MKWRLRKEIMIDESDPDISGTWYWVEPKNFFIRTMDIGLSSECFRNIKDAKRCYELKNKGKWNYIKESKILQR